MIYTCLFHLPDNTCFSHKIYDSQLRLGFQCSIRERDYETQLMVGFGKNSADYIIVEISGDNKEVWLDRP